MKRAYTLSLSIFFSFCSIAGIAQSTKVPIDYLQNPGPISFDKISYRLNWSSHPSDNFYKQEYLVKGDDENRFKTMLLLDVITGSDKLQDIVAAKIAELQQMKQSNPAVSYETFDNKTSGEYMIDFLITQNSADGKSVAIAERNVYRYKIYTDKAGKKMIQLFGVSVRSYGNAIAGFLSALKTNKAILVKQVADFKMPVIDITRK